MKKPLHIFYEKKLVGTFQKKPDDTLSFRYAPTWLSEALRFPLSPALPLREEEFNNRQTKAYFDNLLPEGDTLKTFEKILKRSFEDPYQFLEHYGLDCAGALEITPAEQAPDPAGSGQLEKISLTEIDRIVEAGGSLYVHSLTAHKGRFSLAGAQDKIPVIFREGELYIPLDATPTSHILKPPTRLLSAFESVENEYLCMRLADLCGLPVPKVEMIGKETRLFLVERYDRRVRGSRIERIHQFDLCQAQGYPSGEKYEDDQGPTFAQNYKCIEAISDDKIHDLETCLHWLAFNLLVGNNDSHSKNLSFLYEGEETRVAPLYDILSTSIYPGLNPEFAFSLGGQRHWHQLKRKNLQLLAHELGFVKREDFVVEKILEMAARIEAQAEPLFSEMEKNQPKLAMPGKLREEIEKRIRVFRTKL